MKALKIKFLFLIILVLSISNAVLSITKDAYKLFFSYKNGVLLYEGCKKVCVPRKRIERSSGDWNVRLYNFDGNMVFQKNIRNPRIEYFDELLPDGNLTGGTILRDAVAFTVYVPLIDEISRIKISKTRPHIAKIQGNRSEENQLNIIGESIVDLTLTYINQPLASNFKILGVLKIIDNGPDENRINLVFISEGFGEQEMNLYRQKVNQTLFDPVVLLPTAKSLFEYSPLREFYKCFNFYRLDIANFSWTDIGEGRGNKEVADEFFKDYFHVPPDIYISIRNQMGIGGGASQWHIFMGFVSTPGSLFLHELGHTELGGDVGDEYSIYNNCNDPLPTQDSTKPNITIYTDKEKIKWKHWILDSTSLPTPKNELFENLVGAFEGAAGKVCYYYRPQLWCFMGTCSWRGYCKVCREEFTIYVLTNYIDIFTSVSSYFSVGNNGALTVNYSIELDDTIFNQLINPKIVWYNGDEILPQFDNKKSISIESSYFKDNAQEIKVAVVGQFMGTEEFIRKAVDTNLYYKFPELSKGRYKRKK